jgi:hypothetical protein
MRALRAKVFYYTAPITALFFAVISVVPAGAATTWNWSFKTINSSVYGSETFTTADVTPAANTVYQITGLSRTIFHTGSNTLTLLASNVSNTFYGTELPLRHYLQKHLYMVAELASAVRLPIVYTNSRGTKP